MNKKLIALIALLPCLLLAGCVGAAPTRNDSFTTVAPAEPTPNPSSGATPAAEGIVDTVYVQVFPGRTFKAKHGCRCTLPGSKTELFPAGTPVVLIRFSLTGEWKPAQGSQTSQDVTGTTLNGTKFDGRPEPAVLTPPTDPPRPKQLTCPGCQTVSSGATRPGRSRTTRSAPSPPPGTSRPASTSSSSC